MIVSIAQCLKLILYLRYLKRESRPSRNVLTNQLLAPFAIRVFCFLVVESVCVHRSIRSDSSLYGIFQTSLCMHTKMWFRIQLKLIRILNSCTYNGNKQDLANRQRIPGEFLISYSTRIGYNLYLQRYEIPFFVIIN